MRRAAAGARQRRSREVLPRAEAARLAGASGDRSYRAHPLVRALAGGVGDGVVDRQSRQDCESASAQAEDRPPGCAAVAATAGGRALSAAVGAECGEPGRAAVAVAPASAGADADAGEEPTAGHRAERRGAAATPAVEPRRPEAVGILRAGTVDGAAARRSVAAAGSTDAADRRTEPGHRAGSGAGGRRWSG